MQRTRVPLRSAASWLATAAALGSAVAACAVTSDEPEGETATDALRQLTPEENLGAIAVGETKTIDVPQGGYRAYTFKGIAGDDLDIEVNAENRDAKFWLATSEGRILQTVNGFRGAARELAYFQVGQRGSYVVTFKEVRSAAARFTVSVRRARNLAPPPQSPSPVPAKVPGRWAKIANMSWKHNRAAAAAGKDGRIYGFGGIRAAFSEASVEAYTPSTNSWTTVASMSSTRHSAAGATGADGRIFAIGGIGGIDNLVLATAEAYTPNTDSWDPIASMPTARSALAAATGADGRIYAIGGFDENGKGLATVEAYTPSTKSWASVASMPTARGGLAAATGADGRIYAIGGSGQSGDRAPSATVEAYTPSTNSWATVASMPTPRGGLGAATGADGRVYAVGGWKDRSTQGGLLTVEAYQPLSNSWAPVANLWNTTRYWHAVAAGANGEIYTLGGQADMETPTMTAEVYTP